jgi:hypothetical protein
MRELLARPVPLRLVLLLRAVIVASAVAGCGGGGISHGDGGATCDQIATQYQAAVSSAKMCSAGGPGCQTLVASVIGCNCKVYVADASTLDSLQTDWSQAGCVASCPPISCVAPHPTSCSAGGTC